MFGHAGNKSDGKAFLQNITLGIVLGNVHETLQGNLI